MPIKLNSLSRFKNTELVTRNGIQTFGLWNRPRFMERDNLTDNQIIKLYINQNYEYRPDLIARDYYGSKKLYWIPIMFNRPRNTLVWPKAGTSIEIPAPYIVSENRL